MSPSLCLLKGKIEKRKDLLNPVGFGSYLQGLMDASEVKYMLEVEFLQQLIADNNQRVIEYLSSGEEEGAADE